MFWIKLNVFLRSLWFHVWSGFPKCTLEEIKSRHNICLLCDEYDKIKKVCNICGCNINSKKQFLNKLAWADQECPKYKWSKIQRG